MGRPHLGVGFELRCLQPLSGLGLATQRCPWRDSWYTRGWFSEVLSYYRRLPSSLQRLRQIGTDLSHDGLNPAHVPL